jgi:hypothetical protein
MRLTGPASPGLDLCDFLILIIKRQFTSFPGVPLVRGATVVTGRAAPWAGHAWACRLAAATLTRTVLDNK